MQSMLHCMMGIGILGLVAKLHKWTDSAKYFDGSSLGKLLRVICSLEPDQLLKTAVLVFGISTYLSVTVPSLRTVVAPVPDVDSRSDQIQALQLISAANIINLVIIFLIFGLQVRRSLHSLSPRSHDF